MTSNKETYTGKQCVDNEEAEKIFTFLEDQMNNFSAQFSGMCRKVIYSILHHHGQQYLLQRIKIFVFYYL